MCRVSGDDGGSLWDSGLLTLQRDNFRLLGGLCSDDTLNGKVAIPKTSPLGDECCNGELILLVIGVSNSLRDRLSGVATKSDESSGTFSMSGDLIGDVEWIWSGGVFGVATGNGDICSIESMGLFKGVFIIEATSIFRIVTKGDIEFSITRLTGNISCNGESGLLLLDDDGVVGVSDSLNSGGGGICCLRGELTDFLATAGDSLTIGNSRLGSGSRVCGFVATVWSKSICLAVNFGDNAVAAALRGVFT